LYFDRLLTLPERKLNFLPLDEMVRRCKTSAYYRSEPNGGGKVEACVQIGSTEYQLEFWFEPSDDEHTGFFWQVNEADEQGQFGGGDGHYVTTQVPLTPVALVASLAATFGLDPEQVARDAVDLHAYWQGEDLDDFSCCPLHLADKYRLIPRN
jgi:hypothetical protein